MASGSHIKHAEMMAAATREEAKVQSARAQSWQCAWISVKALVGDVMRAAWGREVREQD